MYWHQICRKVGKYCVLASLCIGVAALPAQSVLAQQTHTVYWPDESVTVVESGPGYTEFRDYPNETAAWAGENPGEAAVVAIATMIVVKIAMDIFFSDDSSSGQRAVHGR